MSPWILSTFLKWQFYELIFLTAQFLPLRAHGIVSSQFLYISPMLLHDNMRPYVMGLFWGYFILCPRQCHTPHSTWHNCFSDTIGREGHGLISRKRSICTCGCVIFCLCQSLNNINKPEKHLWCPDFLMSSSPHIWQLFKNLVNCAAIQSRKYWKSYSIILNNHSFKILSQNVSSWFCKIIPICIYWL